MAAGAQLVETAADVALCDLRALKLCDSAQDRQRELLFRIVNVIFAFDDDVLRSEGASMGSGSLSFMTSMSVAVASVLERIERNRWQLFTTPTMSFFISGSLIRSWALSSSVFSRKQSRAIHFARRLR
jgi:hypothetical protein